MPSAADRSGSLRAALAAHLGERRGGRGDRYRRHRARRAVVCAGRKRAAQARGADDGERRPAARTSASQLARWHPSPRRHELGDLAREPAPGRSARPPGGGLRPGATACPLDVLGAQTEGMIGYLIEQEPRQPPAVRGAVRNGAHDGGGALTADPAFADPTKFVGPVLRQGSRPKRFGSPRAKGWILKQDGVVLAPGRGGAGAQ